MKKIINNLPDLYKSIIIAVIWTTFWWLVKKYTGIDINQLCQNKIFILSLTCFSVILNFWVLGYYSISLYLCIEYSNKTITIPSYLPKFMSNRLEEINSINMSEHKILFMKLFIKTLIFFIIIFIILFIFVLLFLIRSIRII